MNKLYVLILILIVAGCTSIATSGTALIVSLHSNKVERDTRRYSGIDRCFMEEAPDSFVLANHIFYGQVEFSKYVYILNPELKKNKVFERYELAYAFFLIADKLGDVRAPEKIKALQVYFEKNRYEKIEKFINFKYLNSHLTKCYSVDKEFKRRFFSEAN
jgi:hypothetical protein